MDKPIPEAVALLEALQERWCASTAGKDGSRRIATFDPARGARGEDDFDNEVYATRKCASDLALAIERIRALTAAQQQGGGEAVAWCALTPSGKIAYFDGSPMVMVGPVGNEHHTTPLYTAPPSAPVGVEDAGSRAVAAELLRCFESWEPGVRVLGNVQARDGADLMRRILAQQPAAVDGAMTRRIMSEFHANDPGDVWPPDEQGRLRRKALQDAINNALATQHQEPTT